MLLHGAGAVFDIEERGIEPDADAPGHRADAAPLFTLPNNRGGYDVAGIQFVDEPFTLRIDQVPTFGSNALCHQRPDELRGIDRTGGVILERIDVHEFGAQPIGQAQPVAGRTVVIAGRESLNVEPADPAGRQNDGLGGDDDVAMVVEIFQIAPVQLPFSSLVSSTAAQNSSNWMF